ncbi:MAG: alpha/beta fold hydrolase [Deltaproteobacteria bacterium]|nr:alpha/beta fold hydrolase [Deltaproteobacteria bacterium]
MQLQIGGDLMTGTAHVTAERRSNVGMLFINFGYVPRDGHGGLAAQTCDALAASGVPAFRFDLPRIGDTPGELPSHTHQFFDLVTSGGFTQATAALVQTLCEREQLDGVCLGGLCGGAVTAIFAAEREPSKVRALVLLEPEMYVTEPKAKKEDAAAAPKRLRKRDRLLAALKRLPQGDRVEALGVKLTKKIGASAFNYWGWMRFLTYEGKRGQWIPLPRKMILDFVLSSSTLPEVTNMPLASAWQRYVQQKRPVLVITADQKLREVFFDRINRVVLRKVDTQSMRHVRLKGTNHIFTTGGAIETVMGHVVPWVQRLA